MTLLLKRSAQDVKGERKGYQRYTKHKKVFTLTATVSCNIFVAKSELYECNSKQISLSANKHGLKATL